MDKTSTLPETESQARTSELDKVKLHYEVATTIQEERSRIKRQYRNSGR